MTRVPGDRLGARPSSRAMRWMVALVALLPLTLLTNDSELAFDVRTKGALLWLLCILPAWIYFRIPASRRPPLPIFPMVSAVYGVYYAIPGVMGAVNLAYNPNQVRITLLDPRVAFDLPMDIALWGWIMLLIGYAAVAAVRKVRRASEAAWPIQPLVPWLLRMLMVGIATDLARGVLYLPSPLVGAADFLGLLGRFAIATLLAINVRGHLTRQQRFIVLGGFAVDLLVLISSGSIAQAMLFMLLLLVAQYTAGGRIRRGWLLAGAVAVVSAVAIKGILKDYRRQVWFTGVELSVPNKAALMATLVQNRVNSEGVVGTVVSGWETAVARSATLDLLADVVQRTPRDIPYWGGHTYLSLVGLAVPRVLWPNKPTKTLGQDFGHRYSFIETWDTSTSINVPFLIEFYMNFGMTGVLVGMFITGMIYRILDSLLNVPGQSILRSLASLAILMPLLNIESDFSLVFGGIFLNAVAFYVVLRYLRSRIPAPEGVRPPVVLRPAAVAGTSLGRG
ncbi:MAG TPA: hypothetical protein VF761_00345 [Gemmatimonadaceae bacterium]